MSNSEPCDPTRWTSAGSRERDARSRRARPEMTATSVCGRPARLRSATLVSRSGSAFIGSSTIGATVPS